MIIYAVDDEELMLEMLMDAISEAVPDCELVGFENSVDLLKKAKKTPPDIAFMDIEMPEMNGIELASNLKKINPKINLIFVTGYSNYGIDAMQLFASGYIMKPVDSQSVKNVMENLRFSPDKKDHIKIVTFGNFTVFANGKAVKFRFPKSRELLAYLVDRNGSSVSRREAAAVLYEEEDYTRTVQNELSRAARWLTEDLHAEGADEIFISDGGQYRVDTEKFSCDLYDYLKGEGDAVFLEEYMEQYSWGEFRKGSLMDF